MELTERQRQIVDKAIRLLADRGIQHLTIRNLAGAMGVTEPAIYRHFTGKQAILSAILDFFASLSDGVLHHLAAATESDELARIGLFVADRYRHLAAYPPLAKVMFSEEFFQDDPELAARVLEVMHAHGTVISGLIAAGQAAGRIRSDIEARTMFRLIMGPVRLLIKQWGLSGFAFDLRREGEILWRATCRMVAENGERSDETKDC